MKLKCQRCEHIWDYTGANTYYASCPHCKTSVKVAEFIPEGDLNEV